jgi:hypothetical protein
VKKLTLLFLLIFYSYNSSAEEYRKFQEKIIASLKEKYNEVPIIAGKRLSSSKSTISVWGNPATETFTVLDTYGDMTCVLAVGTDITVLLKDGESI